MKPLRHMAFGRALMTVAQDFPKTRENRDFRLERDLLIEIERAFDGLARALREVTNISFWNFHELKQDNNSSRLDQGISYRNPKLVLDTTISKKGNLCVTWRPEEGFERDTVYGHYYNAKVAFERPRNEILIIRNFALAAETVEGDEYFGPVNRERLSLIVDLVRLLIEHAYALMSNSCDVRVGTTVDVKHPPEDEVEWGEDTSTPKMPLRDPFMNEEIIRAFQDQYGVSPATVIGFVAATRRYRMPHAVMAQLLHDHHGMKGKAWSDGFQQMIEQYETKVTCSLALRQEKLRFKGTPLAELKKLFAESFPGRKSWHTGTFTPVFNDQPSQRQP